MADFLLHDVILQHGAPRQLLTDRGRCFLSQVVDDKLRSCSTKHKITLAYHPQTNGLTERLNRTLTDMLSCYVSADHRDWDVSLPYVKFAYNSSRHDKAGYSPFYLPYGREPTLPLDTLVLMSADQPSGQSEYAWGAVARAHHARRIARNRLCSFQGDQKTIFDQRLRVAHFAAGSLVLLRKTTRRIGFSEKRLPRYCGPFCILRQVTDVTYEISLLASTLSGHATSTDIVHVVR